MEFDYTLFWIIYSIVFAIVLCIFVIAITILCYILCRKDQTGNDDKANTVVPWKKEMEEFPQDKDDIENESHIKLSTKPDQECNTEEDKRKQQELEARQAQQARLAALITKYIQYFFKFKYLEELKKKRERILQYQTIDNIKMVYKSVLPLLLELLVKDKKALLHVAQEGTVDLVSDQKEQYKVYGLLLSACIKKKNIDHGSSEAVKQKVSRPSKYPFITGGTEVDTSVNKALSMTWSMLTLLPPLLVSKPQCQYSEGILDTNRHTWDEDKSGPPLYYYRPVLVYGNRLHVAIKGLVGNNIPVPVQNQPVAIAPEESEGKVMFIPQEVTNENKEVASEATTNESVANEPTNKKMTNEETTYEEVASEETEVTNEETTNEEVTSEKVASEKITNIYEGSPV